MSQPEARIVNVDGRRMVQQGNRLLGKANIQKVIAKIGEHVERHGVSEAALSKDLTLAGMSELGKKLLTNVVKNEKNRGVAALNAQHVFEALVIEMDDDPVEVVQPIAQPDVEEEPVVEEPTK